ncbi:MAG: pantoate--beta-alanine ligase [Phycisphaerae bacterium]|nr:pantoate--beta-alanine ligase [Phycisphaerae bacterium]
MTGPAKPVVVDTVQAVRFQVAQARCLGRRIGCVPTMGALHEGHLSLIRAARQRCDYVVVTIFVNPTQFVAGEDLENYPRTRDADLAACASVGTDLVFAPSTAEMYDPDSLTTVRVHRITEPLCGRHRPGHFEGVTTVVTKLFNIVQPDAAYFGQKDAQQAVVLRKMTRDLNFPIEIVVCPTVREPDGLAMSSRNAYLSPEQRRQALSLHRALDGVRRAVAEGRRDAAGLLAEARQTIKSAGPCSIDYLEIVHPETLQPLTEVDQTALVAVAVRIDQARLIDNLLVDPSGPA